MLERTGYLLTQKELVGWSHVISSIQYNTRKISNVLPLAFKENLCRYWMALQKPE